MAGPSNLPSFIRDDDARRDSEDRISFETIARLVKPSLPPSPYDSLSPVAAPKAPAVPSSRSGWRPTRFGFRLLTAALAIAAGVGVAALRHLPDAAAAAPVPAAAAAPEPEPAAAATPEPEPAAAATPEPEPAAAAAPEPASELAPERVALAEVTVRSEDDRGETRDEDDRRERVRVAAPAPDTDTETETETHTSMDTVEAREAEGGAEATALPAVPSREDVQRSLDAVHGAVAECAAGTPGLVTVEVTVGASGRVRNALVTGAFAGTPEGSCMARAVRRARFPRFADDSFTVRYPYSL